MSGGSILAAHLVLNWDSYASDTRAFDAVTEDLLAFVRSDVRGRVVRRWMLHLLPRLILPRQWTFIALLQREYQRLYQNKKLGHLRSAEGVERPQVFFYSSS